MAASCRVQKRQRGVPHSRAGGLDRGVLSAFGIVRRRQEPGAEGRPPRRGSQVDGAVEQYRRYTQGLRCDERPEQQLLAQEDVRAQQGEGLRGLGGVQAGRTDRHAVPQPFELTHRVGRLPVAEGVPVATVSGAVDGFPPGDEASTGTLEIGAHQLVGDDVHLVPASDEGTGDRGHRRDVAGAGEGGHEEAAHGFSP